MEENYKRIDEIDTNKLHKGYLCSSYDPLLNLICELFNLNIDMNFNGHKIEYRYKKQSTRLVHYSCSKSHFTFKPNNKQKSITQSNYIEPIQNKKSYIILILLGLSILSLVLIIRYRNNM